MSVGERNLDISECVCTSKALRITIILTLSATMLCAILAAAHKPFLRRLASSNFLAWTENTLSDLVTTMWFAHLGIRERAIAIDNV